MWCHASGVLFSSQRDQGKAEQQGNKYSKMDGAGDIHPTVVLGWREGWRNQQDRP